MEKTIGIILLALVFVIIAVMITSAIGWKGALIVFLGAGILSAMLIMGIYLINK